MQVQCRSGPADGKHYSSFTKLPHVKVILIEIIQVQYFPGRSAIMMELILFSEHWQRSIWRTVERKWCCQETSLSWSKALPLCINGYTHVSQSQDRSQSTWEPVLSTGKCDKIMKSYCVNLSETLFQIRQTSKEALPRPAEGSRHQLKPLEWILVKDFRKKHWKARRWLGPFQILLITHTAVKVAERATWIHASHCKPFNNAAPYSNRWSPSHRAE